VDTDANIAHRLKRVLSEERPQFERVEPDLMLAALAYHGRDVEEELTIFDLTRRQMGRILQASPAEAWERTGIVGDRGGKSVAQMLKWGSRTPETPPPVHRREAPGPGAR